MLGTRCFRATPIVALVFTLAAGLFTNSLAHPNGVSKVILELRDPDTLVVISDVNRDDVLSAIREYPRPDSLTPEYSRRFMEKVAYYLQSRLRLEVDGRGLSNMQVVSWDSLGKSDPSLIDSSDLARRTFIITYKTQIPPQGQRLAIAPQYFLEFGIQPLSEVSVLWHKQLVQRSWLTPDKTLRLPLSRDSLAARLARMADTASVSTANVDGGFWRFVTLGFTHILPHGLDHILFVLGLFFFSTQLRPLVWQITAFTVAHSLTLALSILGFIQLNPRIVEPLIALSITVVAFENIFFRKLKPSRWLIVFAFGLVHGLGFAGVLSELGIPKSEFWATLIGFNLGVEAGQLAVVAIATALTVWFWRQRWYFKAVVVPISAGIGCVGLYWAIQRVFFP
jgi:hydrogenase/urease accessory protein HupE